MSSESPWKVARKRKQEREYRNAAFCKRHRLLYESARAKIEQQARTGFQEAKDAEARSIRQAQQKCQAETGLVERVRNAALSDLNNGKDKYDSLASLGQTDLVFWAVLQLEGPVTQKGVTEVLDWEGIEVKDHGKSICTYLHGDAKTRADVAMMAQPHIAVLDKTATGVYVVNEKGRKYAAHPKFALITS